eukprot:TRINITY_DN11311_c0_g1_i1.p2 TRINITY_DN11311_c0_g1~~TRINITY_DN11311_c0_g1_i1.p2  ORF type:complete len:767 (+),score=319.32 TRINITY_DN11311_c0_g1_i1:79-2379(+)
MQALEDAWRQHAERNLVPTADEQWLTHGPSVQGWNAYKALPVRRPARTMDEAEGLDDAVTIYQEWCEVYFHALQRREPALAVEAEKELGQLETFGNLEAVIQTKMTNAKREAKRKYFDNTVTHQTAGYLRDAYKFDLAHEKSVTLAVPGAADAAATRKGAGEALGGTLAKGATRSAASQADTQSVWSRGSTAGRTFKSQRDRKKEAQAESEKRIQAKKHWAKLTSLLKMCLLQDTLTPAKVAGASYAHHTLPFVPNNVNRVAYNYEVIDQRVAALVEAKQIDHAAMGFADAAALITEPYAVLTWRNSAEQRSHYSLRSVFKYVTSVFAQAPANAPLADAPDAAEVWKKKEGTTLDFAVLLQAMCAHVEGLKVDVVRGSRRTGINARGHPHESQRVAWNKAEWGHKKYLLNAHGGVESEYFWLTNPATFVNLHYPDNGKDQLAVKAVDRGAWNVAPDPTYHFHTHLLTLQSHVKYRHIVSKAPPLTVSLYAVDSQVEIVPKLYEGAQDAKKLLPPGFVWQERLLSTSSANFTCVLPDTGMYTLEFYVRRRAADDNEALDTTGMAPAELASSGHHLALSYQVVSNTKVGDDPILPLQRVSPSFAVMSEPNMGKLVAGQPKRFVIFPVREDIDGFVIVEKRRQAADRKAAEKKDGEDAAGADGSTVYTVMEYDAMEYAFVATIPTLLRGTLDIFMRKGGEFLPAFTGIHVVTQLSSKEDFGVDLIQPLRPNEVVMLSRNVGNKAPAPKAHTTATFSARRVGSYFDESAA